MGLYNISIGFKIFAVLTCIKEMKHLQDSHTVITSYFIWQGSVGSIYYPLCA